MKNLQRLKELNSIKEVRMSFISFAELLNNAFSQGCKTCRHFQKDCKWSINENCQQCVSDDKNMKYERRVEGAEFDD